MYTRKQYLENLVDKDSDVHKMFTHLNCYKINSFTSIHHQLFYNNTPLNSIDGGELERITELGYKVLNIGCREIDYSSPNLVLVVLKK